MYLIANIFVPFDYTKTYIESIKFTYRKLLLFYIVFHQHLVNLSIDLSGPFGLLSRPIHPSQWQLKLFYFAVAKRQHSCHLFFFSLTIEIIQQAEIINYISI